jgi:AraC-like DNA-binding protein
VRQDLDDRFRTAIRARDVAAEAGRHTDHVGKRFRRRFGMSITAYVAARRTAWAASEILETARSISEIALAAGFYDQSHLTRVFRRVLAATPAEYRRTMQTQVGELQVAVRAVGETAGRAGSPRPKRTVREIPVSRRIVMGQQSKGVER